MKNRMNFTCYICKKLTESWRSSYRLEVASYLDARSDWGLGELVAFFVETQSLQSAVCESLAIYKTVCC